MAEAAIGAIHACVCSLGCSNHRHATCTISEDSSSKPYTVVSIPAIVYVVLETVGLCAGYVFSIGLGADIYPDICYFEGSSASACNIS